MDYERLARTLLRIVAVWLFVQSLSGLVMGAIMTMQFSGIPGGTSSTMWTYPIASGLTMAVGIALFFCGAKLARAVAA